MAVFWSADTDEERIELLKQARNGGSITPKFDKILQQHVSSGRLEILSYTQIVSGSWDPVAQTWAVRLSKVVLGFPRHIDDIKYATGNAPRVENVTCLHGFIRQNPIEAIDGLARITNDLMWNDDIPLFLTGGLAGLRLGPGAANLAGARQGAERIAWKIDQILGSSVAKEEGLRGKYERENDSTDNQVHVKSALRESRSEYTGSFANQFDALAMQLEQAPSA
ncbi:hypothetical protein LTR84_006709 [Exophiala bonariae]|uniref:Uncharacterized protein n=1 Tax=Exophiala bonariae TaxID=1690606 RepID=A0AAV9N3F7_9EURO|nr:hypothetical protein LTR84_006709 [Exophiala bonariae]